MMPRRGILGVLVAGVSALVGGCRLLGGEKSYRFRMTVEVETPQGIKRGSSVMEITSFKKLKLTSEEHAGGGGIKGEAVVVETADGPLFILLKEGGSGQPFDVRVTGALSPESKFNIVDDYVDAVDRLGDAFASTKADLPRADWPLMVRFRDIGDPKSIEQVNPETVVVKRILLETTRDAVTTGIEQRIPWIDHLERYLSNPNNPFTSTLPDDFGGFRSGIK